MTVAQRVRELATLRTLGASRKQVFRSVLLEGFVTGLFAAIIGLLFGLLIAKGLNALFKSFGVDLPSTGTVFSTRTVIVSLLLGVGITVLATISPARRATRVPPIAAVREGATLPSSRLAKSRTAAPIVLGISAVMLAAGLFADLPTVAVVLLDGVGCLLLFIGVGMISSRLVRPLAAAVGAPGERLGGVAGSLAKDNATRNPSRTARTAGRADDRARAGHARRDAGGEPQEHHQGRAQGPGARRLRRDGRRTATTRLPPAPGALWRTRPEWPPPRRCATTRRAASARTSA